MIGYEISVRCICGNENTYILNALRYPVVTLGRLQEGNIGCADIGVCADDKRRMSRKMLHFFMIGNSRTGSSAREKRPPLSTSFTEWISRQRRACPKIHCGKGKANSCFICRKKIFLPKWIRKSLL